MSLIVRDLIKEMQLVKKNTLKPSASSRCAASWECICHSWFCPHAEMTRPVQTAPEPGQNGPADWRKKTFLEVDLCIPNDIILRHLGTKRKCHSIHNTTVTITVDICMDMAKRGPRSMETAIPWFEDWKLWGLSLMPFPQSCFLWWGFILTGTPFNCWGWIEACCKAGDRNSTPHLAPFHFLQAHPIKKLKIPQRSHILTEK